MTATPPPNALRRFVDDELLRAPLVIETVIDAAIGDLRAQWPLLPPRERAKAAELQQSALSRRSSVVRRFTESLRDQVEAELARKSMPQPAAPASKDFASTSSFSLLDDDTVAADVELSHLIEAVKTQAEAELRELNAYTSALMGDPHVTRDHNVFRPDTYVRALWDAVQEMPSTLGFQIAFLRHAGQPLALVLRRAYSGASARLAAGGIDRAAHRTMVRPVGSRSMRPGDSWTGMPPDLNAIRDSMPLVPSAPAPGVPEPAAGGSLAAGLQAAERALYALDAGAGAAAVAETMAQLRTRLAAATASTHEHQLIELLCRLFEAVLTDRRLVDGVARTLAPMLTPALRLALQDRAALDDYRHPLWQFIDRVAFLAEMVGSTDLGERVALLRYADGITQQIVQERRPEGDRLIWAQQRLQAWERHRLEQRRDADASDLMALEALEQRLLGAQSPAGTMSGALDVGQLDTVPAVLLESLPDTPNADSPARWVAQRMPGDWLNVFIQGRWSRAQLLWQSPQGEITVLADTASPSTWAVRLGAMEKLHAEKLLSLLRPRSLAGAAARQLEQHLEAGPAGR